MKTNEIKNQNIINLAVVCDDGNFVFSQMPRFIVNSGHSIPMAYESFDDAIRYAKTLMHHFDFVSIYDLLSGKLTEIYC